MLGTADTRALTFSTTWYIVRRRRPYFSISQRVNAILYKSLSPAGGLTSQQLCYAGVNRRHYPENVEMQRKLYLAQPLPPPVPAYFARVRVHAVLGVFYGYVFANKSRVGNACSRLCP